MSKRRTTIERIPEHVAIILDGNGRWAQKRGLPRTAGHQKGAMNLKPVTLAAKDAGVSFLSVYAFSTENWKRPESEIDYLMELPSTFEKTFKDDYEDPGIRVVFSGRRDRIGKKNLELMERVEEATKDREGFTLNICVDYGGRDDIVAAAKASATSTEDLDEATFSERLYTHPLPDVDLLIRPGGERRLSNFLLWQSAYAELYFTKTLWPDFTPKKLHKAFLWYSRRARKFGGLTE